MEQEIRVRLTRAMRHLKKCVDELKFVRQEDDPEIHRIEKEVQNLQLRLTRKLNE